MASTEPEVPPSAEPVVVEEPKEAAEEPAVTEKAGEASEPPPETKALAATEAAPGAATPKDYFPVVDVVLRVLLFAASVVAVVVLGTSKQTKLIPVQVVPFPVPVAAKFTNSPALIYLISALSVAGFYGLVTSLLSIFALLKPTFSTKFISHFVIFDVLLLGIVASATGTGGAVGYIGYKGDSHVKWGKVCNTYDVFCKHVVTSLAFSLFASVVLALLVLLSIYSLSKKIPK
ncbi:OLC1v1020330C1 [Oldenlandia corymbosa var. corymbosa]|uniref:CASP-like protein n=1 Tax=Oldenlandia corymbosa var. corymbosa TaxID=529605 RepID=A0AAV1EGN6_OLDCO|nr:OLC1v1020330C1 [Oldenlandia corymbosa var. corymbosa]